MFIPEVAHHKHHHHHHQHGDYGDYDNTIFAEHSGLEGRWIGEEGGLMVSGKSAQEVHAQLDNLKKFMH